MRARIFLVFLLLAAASLSAQTFRGTILGTVTDPSGAVIAGGQGDGEEHRNRTGAHHPDQRRRQLLPARTAHRHLHRDCHAELGSRPSVATGVTVDVATRAPGGCILEDRRGVDQGGSLRRAPAPGRDDLR